MRRRLANWFLNRAKTQIGKSRKLKMRTVLDDGQAYVDIVSTEDVQTPYPVSENYYSNYALFFNGYVNEIGVTAPDSDGNEIEIPQHEELSVTTHDIESLDQVNDVQLTTTDAYERHMTNHIFAQALEPVDPNSLNSMGLNKYYIWAALVLLAIMAFGVASGGFTSAAALIPLIPAGRLGQWIR